MEQITFFKDYTNAKSYTQLFHLLEMIENQPKFELVVERAFLFSLCVINHGINSSKIKTFKVGNKLSLLISTTTCTFVLLFRNLHLHVENSAL